MQLFSENLRCGTQISMFAASCIDRKNRCPRKPKDMIPFKVLDNRCMHIPKLRPVALIKYQDNMLVKYFVSFVFADKSV